MGLFDRWGRAGGARRTGEGRRLSLERLEPRWCLATTITPPTQFAYGIAGDAALVGDWDGDGLETPGVFRGGLVFLRNSRTTGPGEIVFQYGRPGDVLVVGDWNGDGIDTLAVVRDGVWHLRNSNTSGVADSIVTYGLPDDRPIAGDWNGDGVATPGIVRRTDSTWHLRNTNTTGVADVEFIYQPVVGSTAALVGTPVVSDWNGDGVETIGVFDAGFWYVRNTNDAGPAEAPAKFGRLGDRPIPANGDFAYVRRNLWVFDDAIQFCLPGDIFCTA